MEYVQADLSRGRKLIVTKKGLLSPKLARPLRLRCITYRRICYSGEQSQDTNIWIQICANMKLFA
jgi:hypothetical protein